MIEAKIRLSANEMELVTNAGWILTKNGILEKAKWMLEDLQQQMVDHLVPQHNFLPKTILEGTPKISKGENYKGLPYLVLDYPRIFHKENTFAIRTMFWWGNFFSTTLHLAGHYKEQSETKLFSSLDLLKNNNFYLCTNEDAWEHHFEASNYIPVTGLTNTEFSNRIEEKPFLKIAKKVGLHLWNDAEETLFSNFKLLMGMMASNFPGDEKAP
jgi:hypothetical protein